MFLSEKQMDEVQLGNAIQAFVDANNITTGEGQVTKEMKEKKNQAKKYIIEAMQHMGKTYLHLMGVHLTLKTTKKKPPINKEFLSQAYFDFHVSQAGAISGLSPEQIAAHFGAFVFFSQKKKSVDGDVDLKISKSKPMSTMLFESFGQTQ